MAEALVNVLLERLATIAFNKVEEEFNLVTGVEKEVECLTRNLEAIRAVLEDAEQRQVTEATVRHWLSELTEVSFDMDDVLDEWLTDVLKRQMERQEQQGESAPAVATNKKKVCPCPSSCFCFCQVNQLMLRLDIAERIRELNERIASIDKEKQRFTFEKITRVPEQPQRQKTTSLPNIKTFGRDEEKNLIISKLLSESSQENEVPLIIPIVGMGGMGKTYLANSVFNDEKIKSHFENRIWVCVSDSFEEIKIAKAIIEELDKNNTSKNSNEPQTLMRCINELLERKTFLLVLDDVWYPTSSQWEELLKPLHSGAKGSRVLVTTRNENVAALMKVTSQKFHLERLSEADCLSLFYYNAGMDESRVSEEFKDEFKDIGLEIVKRCNGLPLAAKTLGSLMHTKKTVHEWRAILNSKTWELKEMQQEVFRPLLLSYHDLTPATKRCLLYCAIFPKDYVYDRDTLIELWMSQDYLNAKESGEKLIVGQSYFDDLVMRSFFQDIVEHDDGVLCKIHDIIHDFLNYLSRDECVSLVGGKRKEVPNDKIRHLTVVNETESESLRPFLLSYKRLRTLHLMSDSAGPMIELIVQLKCLRTLMLCEQSLVNIPERVGELIHLRYLDLSDNEKLVELPHAIGSLYNLHTLRLDRCKSLMAIGFIGDVGKLRNLHTLGLGGCHSLRRIDVGRLISLRHLSVENCYFLTCIKGIENLTELQTLDEFCVSGAGDYEKNKWEHLKDLNQLQGCLTIKIRGYPYPNVAENNAAILVNKFHLRQLVLSFDGQESQGSIEVMNGLKPNQALQYLTIRSYRGYAFSDWISSLHRLTSLSLKGGEECRMLPALGRLASLETLQIVGFYKMSGKVGVEFLGIEPSSSSSSTFISSFPKLRQLKFDYIPKWQEWEGVEEEENSDKKNITIMPCLSELSITSCWMLKALPDFLWKTPLRKLFVYNCPILGYLYRKETGVQWAKISHITNINISRSEQNSSEIHLQLTLTLKAFIERHWSCKADGLLLRKIEMMILGMYRAERISGLFIDKMIPSPSGCRVPPFT